MVDLRQAERDFNNGELSVESFNELRARCGLERIKPKVNFLELYQEVTDAPVENANKWRLVEKAIPGAKSLGGWMQNDYQGYEFEVFKYKDIYFVTHDGFGSCSGCDFWMDYTSIEGKNEMLKSMLAEGNTRAFYSLEDIKIYLEHTQDYFWKDQVQSIEEIIEKHRQTSS